MAQAKALTDRKILKRIQNYRLMDDMFMQACFQDNREAVETVLRVIMEIPDLAVKRVGTQKKLQNLRGRSLCLDIVATDNAGRVFNIEIQRSSAGASPQRARVHSSLLDANVAKPGRHFNRLPETWVILITAKDVFRRGKPLYLFERRESTGEALGDGSHIVYVNGEMREGETQLAKLMHDFFCTDPDRMYYAPLAEAARHFKQEEKGVRKMYSEIAKLKSEGRKEGRMEGRKEGRKEGRIEEKKSGAARMIAGGKLTLEEIANYAGLALDEVRAIAAGQGKG